METNRLRQFCVVYETTNLRKSAEMLHLSHSALSKSLKLLQIEIGVRLFVPEGRGIAITQEGKRLYPKIKSFLQISDSLFEGTGQTPSSFRIGTFEVFSTHVLGQLMGKYFGALPITLHELLPGKLEGAILDSQIDVGLTYEPIPTQGIEHIFMGKVQMGIYAKRGSFIRWAPPEIPFAIPARPIEGTPMGTKGLDGWPDDLVFRKIKYRVDMLESALAAARAGEVALFIPHFVARLHNVCVRPEFQLTLREWPILPKAIERKIYLIKQKSVPENGLIRNFARLVRTECL